MKKHICKYCKKEFKASSLGSHTRLCKNHPEYEVRKQKIRDRHLGKPLSESHKEKLRKTISEKVKSGTWHNSFSKSRTIVYNGLKFYGKWEVNYAKWLDFNNVAWRKPTESFTYEFDGKIRNYTPDFYLITENCYVEIKGYPTEKDRAKWRDFPLKLKILTGKDLFELGIIDSYKKLDK